MRNILCLSLLAFALAACGSSGGDSNALIVNMFSRTPDVTLDTSSDPGTVIHGEGIGPGGGATCGNILEVTGFRTSEAVVFRIEDENGFCFGSDIYEIVLNDVDWKNVRGSMIFANDGDPDDRVNGRAFFVPEGGSAFLVPEIVVLQAIDNTNPDRLILSVPVGEFSFSGDDDANSSFEVQAQIERVVGGTPSVPDFTAPVVVDFVDVFPEP